MKFLVLFFCFLIAHTGGLIGKGAAAEASEGVVDFDALEMQLKSEEGLGGRIHGSVNEQGLFVFTWRHPKSFFVNVSLPIVTESDEVKLALKSLRRHDFVILKGSFVEHESPLKHILVSEIVEIEKWKGLGSNLDYVYEEGVPEEIFDKSSAHFKVHSVANEGRVLVVEYKDRVFPIFNPKPDRARDLYRNDKISVKYKVQGDPLKPGHLVVDYKQEEPLVVLKKITDGHGEPFELEGPLVMFAKSPQIKFNIFAVKIVDPDGEQRNFTLTTDMLVDKDFSLFFEILDTLQGLWDANLGTAKYDRNKFVNENLLVRVSGIKNVISPSQANPQVFIESLKDLKVEILSRSPELKASGG